MSNLTRLDWRSALLDGLAVLLGILLAFAIDAWWDVRGEREEARAYLAAIETELVSNREALVEELEVIRSWVVQSEGFLNDVVAPDASPTYDQIREMVWLTGPDRTTPVARAAIDDLVSSGGFRVIEAPELRRALADYVRALDDDASELEDVRDFFNLHILPYHIAEGSFTEFDWEAYVDLPESPVSFEMNTAAFTRNRVYANLLISRILEFGNLIESHRVLIKRIDTVLELMEK
ncbi:hypothetical protein [Lentisalinibacter salinarum]|uniref:hypothetical protein n=1 Tax=Lentisalinibacter salinarum TaxID=2992239 RepID=UPI00386E2059